MVIVVCKKLSLFCVFDVLIYRKVSSVVVVGACQGSRFLML